MSEGTKENNKISPPGSENMAEKIVNEMVDIDLTSDDVDLEELKKKVKELDNESRTLQHFGTIGKLVTGLAICFSLFQLYTAAFGVLDAQLQRAVHLAFGLGLVFLLYPSRKKWRNDHKLHPLDLVLAILGAATPLYIVTNYEAIVGRGGMINDTDYIIGAIGVLLVIEAARRVVGMPIVLVVLAFVGYAFLGPYMPDLLAHRGMNPEALVGHLYFTTEGIFGIPLGISATFIFLFILFGAYLESTGLGQFFIDIANSLAGWARGGPAKVAVLSSGLMGTISGSSVACVATGGAFTIPMMKKLGYNKEFAGAVEAAAATGGQIMPPIMGAAAFLMAEFMGIPYLEVVKAAVIPAILYFLGIWLGTHFEARKKDLKGIPRHRLPKAWKVFKESGHLSIPLFIIMYLLIVGYTPMRAALVGIGTTIIAAALRPATRLSFAQIVHGLEQGAKSALGVLTACAAAGIIIGIVTATGVGLKLASALIEASGNILIVTLFMVMVTSILLGMGVPTTANYVITSTIAAPALVQMGVPLLAANMFVFYFGIVADITPPVALAAFAGAAISGGNPLKTGVNATKLAIAAFIIPYMFVLNPAMLMVNATVGTIIMTCISATIGMIGISAAMIGYYIVKTSIVERLLLFAGGLCLIVPGTVTDVTGIAILVLVTLYQWRKNKTNDKCIEKNPISA